MITLKKKKKQVLFPVLASCTTLTNKILAEKPRWQKNAMCCFKQILEAAPYSSMATYFTSHKPSKMTEKVQISMEQENWLAGQKNHHNSRE